MVAPSNHDASQSSQREITPVPVVQGAPSNTPREVLDPALFVDPQIAAAEQQIAALKQCGKNSQALMEINNLRVAKESVAAEILQDSIIFI